MVILSLQTLYSSKVTQSELGVWELAEYNGLGCLLNSGSLRGILLAFKQALTQCTGLTKNPHCPNKHAPELLYFHQECHNDIQYTQNS